MRSTTDPQRQREGSIQFSVDKEQMLKMMGHQMPKDAFALAEKLALLHATFRLIYGDTIVVHDHYGLIERQFKIAKRELEDIKSLLNSNHDDFLTEAEIDDAVERGIYKKGDKRPMEFIEKQKDE